MRNWKQRLWSLLLCAAMLVSLCPAAMAEGGGEAENVSYLDETGADRSRDMAAIVTGGETVWEESGSSSGWYVVQNSILFKDCITVSGDVHLILANGCSLEATCGIQVSAGNRLTIYAQSPDPSAMGRLTAKIDPTDPYMDAPYAGIGGNPNEICGDITINGGTIGAFGNYDGAGIGSGGTDAGITRPSGNVTIRGGNITAHSSMGTAIGGIASSGSVTISGGTVTAHGGTNQDSAGIGGGSVLISGGTVEADSQSGPGISGGSGKVTIDDGEVTAQGSSYYAGIDSSGGIIINGGKVEAQGGEQAAGIGGSYGGYGGDGGTITITGGSVTAWGGKNGAGIGGGYGGDGGDITITGGSVTAQGGYYGAGIGGGNEGSGGTITIEGDTVTARGGSYGAGIGGGHDGNGGTITITGGTITAEGNSAGAGIGGSHFGDGGMITIEGGTITAQGGNGSAGIGSGDLGDGGEITINGGTVTALGGGSDSGGWGGSGIGGLGNSKITVNGGTVTALGGTGGPGIGSYNPSNDTFGAGGNAFIMASSISKQDGKDQWSGVIFEEEDGKLYNSPITLTTDAEIPAGKTLVIGKGETLIVGEGVKLTNNGKINNYGTLKNLGTLDGQGTIEGNAVEGSVVHEAAERWERDGSSHWHPCKKADCAEQFGKEAHTFGDWITDTPPTAAAAGSKHRVCSICQYQETASIPATGGGGSDGGSSSGGYTPPTYKPDVSKPGEGGGTPAVSPSNPKPGDTVTVKPRPDSGYEVDTISVTDKNGKPVEVTVKPDGTYTFKQPGGKVKIEVSYKPVGTPETPWNNPFADVSEDDWYYEAVRFVQERDLMNGYSDGRFGPDDTLSRAQLAQILFNKEGRPGVDYLLDFSDVAGEAWYTEAVRWAASQGTVGGYGNGTFGPNDPITREQLAVMLWRYSGSPAATNKELNFNDESEIGGYAQEALRWAVENGILNGYGDGRLGPKGQATRAQVAQMLKNFIKNQEADT